MKLSIIIPVYNEAKSITEIIEKVKSLPIEKEIIVVNDGSTDNSEEILANLDNIKIIHKENGGKGSAIIAGLKEVSGDIVVIQDADLEYDPRDFIPMMERMNEDNSKVVYGSRLLHPNYKISYKRYFWGGKIVTKVANLLYGLSITDESTCYKMIDTELLKSLKLECQHFDFCPEVTAKVAIRKIKISEIPISYYPRSIQEGKKIRARDGIMAIWALIKYKIFK